MSKYPYRDAVKVIRAIESCKTLEQLEVAKKMAKNYKKSHKMDTYCGFDDNIHEREFDYHTEARIAYENKLKELNNESV